MGIEAKAASSALMRPLGSSQICCEIISAALGNSGVSRVNDKAPEQQTDVTACNCAGEGELRISVAGALQLSVCTTKFVVWRCSVTIGGRLVLYTDHCT